MKKIFQAIAIATFFVIQCTNQVEAGTIFISQENTWYQKNDPPIEDNQTEPIILKIKDSSNEKILSSLELEKNSQVIKIKRQGNYLYVVTKGNDRKQNIPSQLPLPRFKQEKKLLLIVSLHNHLEPKIVSTIELKNPVSTLAVDENHAKIYLINSGQKSGKVDVINISNLQKPKIERSLYFRFQILNIESEGGRLYLATKKGLRIFDATNLSRIGEIKNIGHTLSPLLQSTGFYSSLAFSDKFIAMGNYAGAIKILDKTELTTLIEFQFDLNVDDCLMNITIDEQARTLVSKIDDDVYQMNYPKKEMHFNLDNLLFCYEKYQTFLFRKPTIQEIEQWLPLLENKELTQAGLAYLLVSTDEFKKKAQKIFPQLSTYKKDGARWKVMAMRFFMLGRNPTSSTICDFHSLAIKGVF